MANIWNRLLKDSIERANGRIWFYPGFWRLEGSNEGKLGVNGILFQGSTDDLDRPMEMVDLRSLLCPLPEWETKYAKYKNKYWIPARLCRKCEYYRKRRRGAWYPCCAKMAAPGKRAAVAKDLNDAWNNANDFANSIMGTPKKPDSD